MNTAPSEVPLRAAVAGGDLVGSVWHPSASAPTVLALHGITANHRSFAPLADRLPVRLVAPDLRGRGRSNGLPPPYGLSQLADDAARVLDALDVENAVVVGHSMGAFVAARLADRHPGRVSGLVLVDGGLPLRPVADPQAALGPALDRLSMTFPSREAYHEFWRAHPGIGPFFNDAIIGYLDHDLVPAGSQYRASAVPEAVLTAMAEIGSADGSELGRVTVPAVLLRSPRGMFDETPGLYDDTQVATWRERLPALEFRDVPDTNHYTILLGSGVAAVADAVRTMITSVVEERT